MSEDPRTLTVSNALDALRSGQLTADELAAACLRQIERLNPRLNAFITIVDVVASEATLAPALRAGASAGEQSPLYGIPLAVKDLYDTAGIRTTGGSLFYKDNIPSEDAVVLQKLKSAGARVVGKTNTHEIALGLTGINPHFGTCRNPWDTSRISGGSSSGSAVAVATGMSLAALGTDTGGSIRVPAALCGVVGLKPTYGRTSLRGILPLSWNLDHAGPLTKTVRDAALLLQIMACYDPQDPASADVPVDDYLLQIDEGVAGWRIALAAGEYFEEVDPDIAKAIGAAADVFQQLGAEVHNVDLTFLREAALANSQMVIADGAAFHRERLAMHPEMFGEDVRQRLEMGRAISSTDYSVHRRTQIEMRRRMQLLFNDYDLVLTPTTPVPAPPIEGSDAVEQARRLTRFTSAFNLTGPPALSIPCGFTSAGLPIGLQLVASHWREAKLLQAGHAFEMATPWHERTAGP